ncbi:hypothetical protein EV643_14325 [Kribbella sp. VKM Ac-2527]|uniref:Uncharacterized protein n=1 Tax=Kribbella caucasensis TaxID=2512215 RepID=A0A4V3C5H4_9ACTN|nr:hypothetical protein EV643_14325 [Kribbella sp. VKM Ac-2527]
MSAGVLAAAPLLVGGGNGSGTQAVNRRPICDNLGFSLPSTVGGQVRIPVTDVAADPDVTPVRLVSVFGGAPVGSAVISDNGTPAVLNDDILVFTRTSPEPGTVFLYWTVSDGSSSAQCGSHASDEPPPENG